MFIDVIVSVIHWSIGRYCGRAPLGGSPAAALNGRFKGLPKLAGVIPLHLIPVLHVTVQYESPDGHAEQIGSELGVSNEEGRNDWLAKNIPISPHIPVGRGASASPGRRSH
jgi:hypothetical protein